MSQLRDIALKIVNNSYTLGMKYVKHRTFMTFFTKYFKPRIDNIILKEASEQDIKIVMWANKKLMDEAIKMIDFVELINEGEDLGSPHIAEVGDIKKAKQFTRLDEEKAIQLLKDLKLC